MHAMTSARWTGRRALASSVLAGAFLAAMLGIAADPASAAYTAHVEAGTLQVRGDGASDTLALRLQSGSPGTLQVDVGADGTAEFSFDRSTFTAIDVDAGPGADEVRIDQSGGTFTDEQVTIDGGSGADTLLGGAGADTLLGGPGNDVVSGGQGTDTALLGPGADRFDWHPGDSSDVVEGESGNDLLEFFGANVNEQVEVSANGSRTRFTRNVAAVVMDLDGVETVSYHALGGADTAVVNDLGGTAVTTVDVDLAAIGGGGDLQPDKVIARGTDAADSVKFTSADGKIAVGGLAAVTRVAGGEPIDDVVAETLGGADTIAMTVGTPGDATVNADGGADADVVRYSGTAGDDTIDVVANGAEASVLAPGTARLDTAVESLVILGLGGGDTIGAVGNLAAITQLTLDGGPGDDRVNGGNGADILLGGTGDDIVDGNQGNDQAQLGSGADTFHWDPGDGSDTVEGQGGEDVLDFSGSNIGEAIDLSANGSRLRFTRNVGAVVLDTAEIERVNFHALGGADAIVVGDLTGTGVRTADIDLGAVGGVGDGQPDSVTARGTEGADRVTLSSPGGYPIVSGLYTQLVVEGVEAANDDVNVATLGGDDTITTGREVFGPASYNVDGGEGTDVTRYNGTDGSDTIAVAANGAEVSTFSALASRLDTTAVESLVLLGLGGEDTMTAAGNLVPLTELTLDGGEGNDTLLGGNGADILLGGDGDDLVDGNQGNDRALLGAGTDTFHWDPGDGSDTIDGQVGDDLLDFNGSNIGEKIDLSADGRHLRLTRDVGAIALDANAIERVVVRALGGADTITVDDLTRTTVGAVDVDLAATGGGGDAQPDKVVVNGTGKADVVDVTRPASQVLVAGLSAQTRIAGSEAANDTLLIQTLGGRDTVTVAPTVSDLITTVVDLGAGQ